MHAVRTIRLCTKDCLCLYVCPTGATDTETGQIDAAKCLDGCRVCVDACPSHAISLVPDNYPPEQAKTSAVAERMRALARSKAEQERLFGLLGKSAGSEAARRLAKALGVSNRLMAEDMLREAGYLLPQSKPVRELLQGELDAAQGGAFPREAVRRLLALLAENG